MAWAVILVVVAAWGAFLLPEVIGSRKSAPLTTTQEFNRWTTRVASVQTPGGPAVVARNRVLARRRRVLFALFGAAILSLVVAIWLSAPSMLITHVVIDAVVAWYVAMLVQLRHRRNELALVTAVRPVSDGVKEMPSTPDVHILASG
ncbi:MAG TPA: hypothetical protein VLT15_08765 [Acidimicrobiia bacterium]|nr:hypothetical protein [Acidimicrobiia bacterium]